MFIILPMGVDYRARRYPVVTFTVMGLCTAIYLATLIVRNSGDREAVDDWVYEYLWLTPNTSHWWTYLTSQFVHGGFFHLLGNMIYLFLFGACVEDMIGRWRFTIFYLLCGLAAAFAHVMFAADHFASEIPMGGASGAISGCIGGFLLLLAKSRIQFKWFFFFMFRFWNGEFEMPAWLVISFWFLQDFAMMLLAAQSDRLGGGVAVAAHVGGTLCGAGLMAIERVRLKLVPEEEEEREVTAADAPVRMAAHAAQAAAAQMAPVVRSPIRLKPATAPAPEPPPAAAPVVVRPVLVPTPTIFLSQDAVESGPFTIEQIQKMFRAGEIGENSFYWQEGMEEWRAAVELQEPGVN